MSMQAIIAAANEYLALHEAAKSKGLRHPRHAKHIKPARAAIESVMRSYWDRQQRALLKEIKPDLRRLLILFPPRLQEAADPHAKQFASNALPSSLSPLRFSVTKAESDDYSDAIKGAIEGAARVMAKEIKAGKVQVADFAGEYLRDNSLTKLTGDISAETVDRLRSAIADAWQQGGNFDRIVQAIEDTYSDFSEYRAQMIAQTEANSAYAAARRDIAEEAGLDEKRWDPDGEACAICQDNADAGWISMEDDFPSGDSEPVAHPNCDCGIDFRKSSEDEED